jgi:hypothetical protein
MKSRSIDESGIDEWGRQIEAPATCSKHPLDEVLDLFGGQDNIRKNVTPRLRTEDLSRSVDPDLFDLGVIEEGLQSTEPGDLIDHSLPDRCTVRYPRQVARQDPTLVVIEHLVHELLHAHGTFPGRVEPPPAYELAYLLL